MYCTMMLVISIYSVIVLGVSAKASEIKATHHTDTPVYGNNNRITFSTTIAYNYTDIASLALEIKIPDKWRFLSFLNSNLPVENNNGLISTYWLNIPASINIQYELEVNENDTDIQSIAALVKYRRHGIDPPLYADVLPNPLQLASSGYYITATAGIGGQITPSGTMLIAANQSQTLTIKADKSYTISTLLLDNQPASITSHLVFDSINNNHTIDVSFKKEQYQLVIQATDGGTASPSGILNVDYGAMQQIQITPNSSYLVESVYVNGEAVSLTGNELSLFVISNMNIDITFCEKQLLSKQNSDDSSGGCFIETVRE